MRSLLPASDTWKDCEEHEDNHFVGGCISCTYAEMRRFQVLYKNAAEVLLSLDETRERQKILEAKAGHVINGYIEEMTR
ncbi:hypothetical protein FHT44_005055 [Mycolicibacterium sp. BK634]|nr:hypothetical protein [Mycolicibacterium sp. BK634]